MLDHTNNFNKLNEWETNIETAIDDHKNHLSSLNNWKPDIETKQESQSRNIADKLSDLNGFVNKLKN